MITAGFVNNGESQRALVEEIQDYVRAGGGAEAVSFVHRSLQSDGWKRLGNLADFESLVERLGFVVRDGKNERGQSRREIAVRA